MAELNKDQLQEQLTQIKRQLEDTQHELATTKLEAQAGRDALVAIKAENTELEEQLDASRSENGELAGELNEVRAELSESQEMVGDLQERLSKAAAIQAQSDSVIVSDGTDHYKVLAPKFKHKHVEYTAEQLRDNEALVQTLVKAGVGFLQKIESKIEE